jgi:hypothetical protein
MIIFYPALKFINVEQWVTELANVFIVHPRNVGSNLGTDINYFL